MRTATPMWAAWPRQIEKTGAKALLRSIGILGTCIKEAPEFGGRRRHADAQKPAEIRCERAQAPPARHVRFHRQKRLRRRRADHAPDPLADPREARRRLHRGRDSRAGQRQAREVPRSGRRPFGSARAVPEGARRVDDARATTRSRTRPSTTRAAASSSGIRKLLQPILKLFFNPNPLIDALHIQSKLNDSYNHSEALYYELIHNLVLETTRLGIEVKNLKMRVESMSSRLDFDERRARALEGVVQYRPGAVPPLQPPARAVRRASRCTGDRRRAGGTAGAPAASPRTAAARISVEAPEAPKRRRAPPADAGRARGDRGRGSVRARAAGSRLIAATSDPTSREARASSFSATAPTSTAGPSCTPATSPSACRGTPRSRSLTTCARDYVTWRNELPGRRRARQRRPGPPLSGQPRTPAARFRPPLAAWSSSSRTPIADELAWLESEGPASPALIDYVARSAVALRLRPLLQLSLLPRVARRAARRRARRSWSRPPSAIRRSGCRSSARSSGACARSCTTRPKSAR